MINDKLSTNIKKLNEYQNLVVIMLFTTISFKKYIFFPIKKKLILGEF